MTSRTRWSFGLALGGLVFFGLQLPAQGQQRSVESTKITADNLIDRHIAAGWKQGEVEPAGPAGDAEFLRRIYLDLSGRVPSVAEARKFLDDKNTDKRRLLVDRLLEGPRYATHFSNLWRVWWLPETTANPEVQFLGNQFGEWLRRKLSKNVAYDQVVRDIIAMQYDGDRDGYYPSIIYRGNSDTDGPSAYYQTKTNKPEELAAGVGRAFLGLKLDCAQCHDHPFADWRREQFWGLAAFFAGLPQQRSPNSLNAPTPIATENFGLREITIPDTKRVIKAAFLDKTPPKFKDKVSPRVTLADWVTAADNPYFARAAVNRVWAYLLGAGIIEPIEEIAGGQNKASHPELLDKLAQQFIASKYDLKFLIRTIVNSGTYQLSSAGKNGGNAPVFARMALRGLSAEQLWDSLARATGFDQAAPLYGNGGNPRAEFMSKFARGTDKASEQQTSILQALTLMNGKIVADATSLEKSETLAAVADAPFMDTAGKIETLYLAALSRRPSVRERERMVKYVQGRGQRGLADVFWVLLNSSEFVLNH